MRATDFYDVTIGTAMIYRVPALNTGVGIIFASLSGLMSALLLFLIDFTRHQDWGVNIDKALQRLVRVLFPVESFAMYSSPIPNWELTSLSGDLPFPVTW